MALTTREQAARPGDPPPSRGGGWGSGGAPSSGLWWATIAVVVLGLLLPVITSAILLEALYNPSSGALPKPKPGVESQGTRLFDSTGKEIAAFHRFETHVPVTRDDIPQVLKDAVVSIEDKRFYSHKGIDLQSIVRAMWADLQGGTYKQGASTITQQYVKRIYTGPKRSLARKVREAVLAGRLEHQIAKDEILYRYLSDIYLGGGAYGVGAAADNYFHKRVKDLTLSEAALLAGLIRSPSQNEPRGDPTAAETRRQTVLREMASQHRISSSQLSEAMAQRVVLTADDPNPSGPATLVYPPQDVATQQPYFVDYVRRYLVTKYGEDTVYRKGLRVETTIDSRLQSLAEASVGRTLAGTSPPLDMALVSLDPTTGFVKAVVGGRDFAKSQVNLALGSCAKAPKPDDNGPICVDGGGTGRQPGSSFKPFTLAKALEKGISPDKVYNGPASITLPRCSGTGCTVHNAEGGGYGALTIRQATAFSVNTVFAQLILDVGVKDTAEMAHRLGITMVRPDGKQPNGQPYGPSLTLGAAEVSPLDMASAFGVFAKSGEQEPATPVSKVTDADGKVLEDNAGRSGRRVISSAIADTVTDILKGVIAFGTGKGADIGRPNGVAGKTGTAENYSDAWFVGFSKTLSTSVWMGYANSQRPLVGIKGVDKVFGGTLPAATWKDYMSQALQGVPDSPFPGPGIVPTSALDSGSGSGTGTGDTGGTGSTGGAGGTPSAPGGHGGPPASVEPQPGPVYTVPPDTTPVPLPPSPPTT